MVEEANTKIGRRFSWESWCSDISRRVLRYFFNFEARSVLACLTNSIFGVSDIKKLINFFKMKGIIPNPHIEAVKFEYEKSYTVKNDAPDILYEPAPIIFAQPAPNTYIYNPGNPPPPGSNNSYDPPKY